MAALVPNVAKGRIAHYASLPETSDALVWVVLTGTETDANVLDADTLTAVLATSLNEATFTGYSRQTATNVSVTVDDTNDWVDIDADDPTWLPTSAQAVTRIALCYDPATGSGDDDDLIPIFVDDFAFTTPTSGSITYQVASGGMLRAA